MSEMDLEASRQKIRPQNPNLLTLGNRIRADECRSDDWVFSHVIDSFAVPTRHKVQIGGVLHTCEYRQKVSLLLFRLIVLTAKRWVADDVSEFAGRNDRLPE